MDRLALMEERVSFLIVSALNLSPHPSPEVGITLSRENAKRIQKDLVSLFLFLILRNPHNSEVTID